MMLPKTIEDARRLPEWPEEKPATLFSSIQLVAVEDSYLQSVEGFSHKVRSVERRRKNVERED